MTLSQTASLSWRVIISTLLIQSGDIEVNPGPRGITSRERRDRRKNLNGTAKPQNLKIIQINIDGVRRRTVELANLLSKTRPDIVCMQETKLNKDAFYKGVQGYTCFRQDRVTARSGNDNNILGGGLITLIKDAPHLMCKQLTLDTLANDVTTERLAVEVVSGEWKCKIINVYVPPIWESHEGETRTQNFNATTALVDDENTLILGDFNAHNPDWDPFCESDSIGDDISDWIVDNGAQLGNDGSHTFLSSGRAKKSTPDISLAIGIQIKEWKTLKAIGTNHLPIMFQIEQDSLAVDLMQMDEVESLQTKYAWSKCDWEKFSMEVDSHQKEVKPSNGSTHSRLKCWIESLKKASNNLPRGSRKETKAWWSNEIEDAVKERNNLRENAHLSDLHREEWVNKSQEVRKLIEKGKNEAWKRFAESLSSTTNPSKTWKVLKRLKREIPNGSNKIITHEGKDLISDEMKAREFCKMFASVAKREICDRDMESRREEREIIKNVNEYIRNDESQEDGKEFDMTELHAALRKVSKNKAAGPDGIYNEMLWNVSDKALKKLLSIFNQIFRTGEIPEVMKAGTIIPLPKPGKNHALLQSFRPVTLTSTLAKLLERMINNRVMYTLEQENVITGCQSGFRCKRNTTDQLVRLASNVCDGFQHPRPHKRTIAALVDFSRAFDKVDHLLLINELCKLKIAPKIVGWFKSFLTDRRNKVKVRNTISESKIFSSGVPQGTVTGPTLFIIYINTLARQLEQIPNLKFSMFADDLTLWCTNSNTEEAAETVQLGLNIVIQWAKKYRMKTAAEKCEAILFSNWPNDQHVDRRPKLYMEEVELQYKDSVKLLGVILDTKLRFGKQIEKIQKEANIRLSQMRALACSTWGCSPATLRTLYSGYVRSVLEYGAEVWGCLISDTNVKKLEVLQNKAARLITGCVSSTDTQSLLLEANLYPMETRLQLLSVKKRESMIRMPENDPLRKMVEEERKPNRLKTKSWMDASNNTIVPTGLSEEDIANRELLNTHLSFPPWNCNLSKRISLCPNLCRKVARIEGNETERKLATMETLEKLGVYDLELWTDGSVKDFKSTGAAVLYDNLQNSTDTPVKSSYLPAGKLSASYHAEVVAMITGLDMIINSPYIAKSSLLICSDSQSTIRKLEQGPIQNHEPLLEKLWKRLFRVASQMPIKIQFVAAHCGIVKNEAVDDLAKNALDLVDQSQVALPFECATVAMKKEVQERWRLNTRETSHRFRACKKSVSDTIFCGLDRKKSSLLAQLRCGKSRWIGEWRVTAGLTDDSRCRWCRVADESVEHIFSDCPSRVLRRLRREKRIKGTTVLMQRGSEAVDFVLEALEYLK